MANVANAKSTAVANLMDDLFDSQGQGMETIGAEDMQIPFLRILQPLSPSMRPLGQPISSTLACLRVYMPTGPLTMHVNRWAGSLSSGDSVVRNERSSGGTNGRTSP